MHKEQSKPVGVVLWYSWGDTKRSHIGDEVGATGQSPEWTGVTVHRGPVSEVDRHQTAHRGPALGAAPPCPSGLREVQSEAAMIMWKPQQPVRGTALVLRAAQHLGHP